MSKDNLSKTEIGIICFVALLFLVGIVFVSTGNEGEFDSCKVKSFEDCYKCCRQIHTRLGLGCRFSSDQCMDKCLRVGEEIVPVVDSVDSDLETEYLSQKDFLSNDFDNYLYLTLLTKMSGGFRGMGSVDGSFSGRFSVNKIRSLEKKDLTCVDKYDYKVLSTNTSLSVS